MSSITVQLVGIQAEHAFAPEHAGPPITLPAVVARIARAACTVALFNIGALVLAAEMLLIGRAFGAVTWLGGALLTAAANYAGWSVMKTLGRLGAVAAVGLVATVAAVGNAYLPAVTAVAMLAAGLAVVPSLAKADGWFERLDNRPERCWL